MGKVCQICGKNSGMYPLCREHLEMKAKGKVIKCDNCGKWHLADKPCECQNKVKFTELPTEGFDKCVACGASTNGYAFCRKCFKKYTEDEMLDILNEADISLTIDEKIDNTSKEKDEIEDTPTLSIENTEEESNSIVIVDFKKETKCIICGAKTNKSIFCTYCNKKYKNKEFLFRIKEDESYTKFELLDADYESKVPCKDGHVAKSKSEKFIDDYLFDHGIAHAYEKPLSYGASEKEVLHPDFYLPNYLEQGKDVYIEHWGYNEDNIKYTNTKKFKMPIYKKLGITLICTYEKDIMSDIEAVLNRKLNKKNIKENEINFEQ